MARIRRQADNDDDGDNVIRDLLLLESLKKTKNIRQVVVNELRKLSAKMDDEAGRVLLLAAADLLNER